MTKKNYGKLNVTLVQNLRRKISEIRGAEENFRMIFEGTRDGILVADNETRNFIMANPAICKMLGYTKEELLKLGITRIHPKKDLPAVIDAFEKQLRGELIIAEALPVLRKDGIVILCDITSAPIKINGKDVLMGVFKDVTEKKKAEEELKATEMRYKTLFDNIPFLSQSVTPEAKIVYVNRKWKEVLGYSDKDIQKLKLWDIIHKNEHEHCKKLFREVMSGKPLKQIKTIFVSKSGSKIQVEGTVIPIARNGKVIATDGIFWETGG